MNEQDRIQHAIDTAKDQVKKAESLERLWRNKDFQALVVNGFMLEEAAHAIRNSVCTVFSEESRKALIGKAQAAGYLSEYFDHIRRAKENAEVTIRDNTQFLLDAQHGEGN